MFHFDHLWDLHSPRSYWLVFYRVRKTVCFPCRIFPKRTFWNFFSLFFAPRLVITTSLWHAPIRIWPNVHSTIVKISIFKYPKKNFNFKEILSPSETKNQRFCYLWGQYEVYEDIISDLTYKNFLYSETKRFLMISQIFSKII